MFTTQTNLFWDDITLHALTPSTIARVVDYNVEFVSSLKIQWLHVAHDQNICTGKWNWKCTRHINSTNHTVVQYNCKCSCPLSVLYDEYRGYGWVRGGGLGGWGQQENTKVQQAYSILIEAVSGFGGSAPNASQPPVWGEKDKQCVCSVWVGSLMMQGALFLHLVV